MLIDHLKCWNKSTLVINWFDKITRFSVGIRHALFWYRNWLMPAVTQFGIFFQIWNFYIIVRYEYKIKINFRSSSTVSNRLKSSSASMSSWNRIWICIWARFYKFLELFYDFNFLADLSRCWTQKFCHFITSHKLI